MTTAYNPVRQCNRKIRYRTKRIAKAAAIRLEQIHGGRLRAYRCPWCNTFHLGHTFHRTEPDISTPPATPPPPPVVAPMTFNERRAAALERTRAERAHRLAS